MTRTVRVGKTPKPLWLVAGLLVLAVALVAFSSCAVRGAPLPLRHASAFPVGRWSYTLNGYPGVMTFLPGGVHTAKLGDFAVWEGTWAATHRGIEVRERYAGTEDGWRVFLYEGRPPALTCREADPDNGEVFTDGVTLQLTREGD